MKFHPANLDELLKRFLKRNQDVQAIAIMTEEGLPIAHILPKEINEAHIAALTAVIQFIGEKVAGEMNKGELLDLAIKSTDGYLFLSNVGQNAVLIVSTSSEIKTGLLYLEINKFIEKLGTVSEENLAEVTKRLISLLDKKGETIIERSKLPELFNPDLLNLKVYDGLPSFIPNLIIQLKILDFDVKCKGPSIKISLSK